MKDISLHVLDIAENSIAAKATLVTIEIAESGEELRVTVTDDGTGMDEALLERVQNPFTTTRTTRKVGLGIPMFAQNARQSGGSLTIGSEPGKGTTISALFIKSSIDCLPLGDMGATLQILIAGNDAIDFRYIHSVDEDEFTLDTRELREILGDAPLSTPDVIIWIRDYLREGEAELLLGVDTNEIVERT